MINNGGTFIMKQAARHKSPENAFHDLSAFSSHFRQKIIKEFDLLDSVSDYGNISQPIFNTKDFGDPKLRSKIMLDNPFQLIKFRQYARSGNAGMDKRFTRTRNLNSLPLGVWAGSLVNNNLFQWMIQIMIFINMILLAVDAQIKHQVGNDNVVFLDFMKIFNALITILLWTETILHFLDDASFFKKDGFIFAETCITVISTIPEVAVYFGTNNWFRAIRLIRVFKLVARSSSMRLIILTILTAFKSMSYIMTFVFIVFYVYAIVMVNLFEDYTRSKSPVNYRDYFDTFLHCILSLFQLLTLDIWDHINRDVKYVSDPIWTQIVIISWVWLGCFIFRGIFTGVIIQNFDRIADSIKEEKAQHQIKSQQDRMIKLHGKLDRELSKQHDMESSINNLKSTMEGILKSSGSLYDSQTSLLSTEGMEHVIKNIQKVIKESYGSSKSWEKNIGEALKSLTDNHRESEWPRDTLFKYFQTMQELQENMQEFQELDRLATLMILEMNT